MKHFDPTLFSVVFGAYGAWNIVCTIKKSGIVRIDSNQVDILYQGGNLMKFAKEIVRENTGKKRLPVADVHYYRITKEMRSAK